MKNNEGRKELKESLKYINNIKDKIAEWQEKTENFFDKALGDYDGKKIEEDKKLLSDKIEEDKKLLSDISDKITFATIELMNQHKENIDAFVSDYKSREIFLSEEGKTLGKKILLPYLEYFGEMDIYGAFKNTLPEKDYNQIAAAHREVISHLEKAIESMEGK